MKKDFAYVETNYWSKEIIITHYLGNEKHVEIPAIIDGYQVVEIGKWAFYNRGITSVYFPRSIIQIGKGAFLKNEIKQVAFHRFIKYVSYNVFDDNVIIEYRREPEQEKLF